MGTQLKKHQVHLVPTDDGNPVNVPFVLLPQKNQLHRHAAGGEFRKYIQLGFKGQHLYFTSDEEIKEGDWFLNLSLMDEFQTPYKCETRQDALHINKDKSVWRKIVATTNPELWNKCPSCGGLNDHFEHCPRISKGIPENNIAKIDIPFIEAYIRAYNDGKPITEVMLEFDEADERCVGSACYCLGVKDKSNCGNYRLIRKAGLKLKHNGSVIVRPVKERMYTRDELKKACSEAMDYADNYRTGGVQFDTWFDKKYSI